MCSNQGALCDAEERLSTAGTGSETVALRKKSLGSMTVVTARPPAHLGNMLVLAPRFPTELDGRLRLATARGAAETEIIVAQ